MSSTKTASWVLAGLFSGALSISFAEADEPLRTWTNRGGNRQVQARLVAVYGPELRLVNAAGRPAKTMVEALSDIDRQYVEAYLQGHLTSKQAGAKDSKPGAAFAIVRGVLEKLPGVPGALSHLATPDSAGTGTDNGLVDEENPGVFGPLLRPLPAALPAELVQVRLSRDFLESFIERNVQRQQLIQDNILGTRISGTANTRGNTQLILRPDESRAVAEVVLRGTIQSQTIGYNGPVRLHCTSQTPFESHKFVYLSAHGIYSSETRSTASTRSVTHHIDSMLPGLRGRIAERMGWRRSSELGGKFDEIASRHTEQRLNQQFSQSVDRSIAMARKVFHGKIEQLPMAGAKLLPQMCYRSTSEYLEMVLRSQDAAAVAAMSEPSFDGKADIAIRVHRAVVRNVLTDPAVRKVIQPLLAGLVPLQVAGELRASEVLTSAVKNENASEFHVSWSDDQDWIEIDFSSREPQPSTPEHGIPAKSTVVER